MNLKLTNPAPEQEYALTAFVNTAMLLVEAWCAEGRPPMMEVDSGLLGALDFLSGSLS